MLAWGFITIYLVFMAVAFASYFRPRNSLNRATYIARIICLIVLFSGLINSAWYIQDGRGTAQNGMIEDGRYYFGNGGIYTEVAQLEYERNRLHGYSVFATFPLTLLVFYALIHTDIKKGA